MWWMHVCKDKGKNLKKQMETITQQPGEHLFLDATSPFPLTIGRSKFDVRIVDQFSWKMWTMHIKLKMQITDVVNQHLDAMKAQGKKVKYFYL